MNIIFFLVFLYVLSTTETIAAEERYPSLAVAWPYTPMFPSLTRLSTRTCGLDVVYGFTFTQSEIEYYFYCPASSPDEKRLNLESSSRNALFYREGRKRGEFMLLDEPLPTCESPVRASIRKIKGKKERYEMGFAMHQAPGLVKLRDDIPFNQLIDFNFNQSTKTTTSVEYTMHPMTFMRIASNKTDGIAFDENLELLGNGVNRRYEHFRKNLLPKMIKEQSSNPIAHALGIQKVSLAPKDDFVADAWKTATYADAITAPIWRILLLKWNAIEIFVRKATRFDVSLLIVNGVSGTLETIQQRYTKADREVALHMPRYLWKMVTPCEGDEQAILIVMHNDPFQQTKRHSCAESCTQHGWPIDNHDYRTGLIYCCRVTSKVARQFNIVLKNPKSKIMDITDPYNNTSLVAALTNYDIYDTYLETHDW